MHIYIYIYTGINANKGVVEAQKIMTKKVICIHMYMFIYLCIYMFIFVSMYVYVNMYVYTYIHIYICIYIH
jgi:hypothetical protein